MKKLNQTTSTVERVRDARERQQVEPRQVLVERLAGEVIQLNSGLILPGSIAENIIGEGAGPESADETIKDPDLIAWLDNEDKKGGIVDVVKLGALTGIKTPEQALKYMEELVVELQAKLPCDRSDINRGFILENRAENIIGKCRMREKTIYVSRRADEEYGGSLDQQRQHAKEADADIVSLSPAENLTRLLQIANEVWDDPANKNKTDDEKKQEVFETIIAADYGYARNFQGIPVEEGILESDVERDGKVFVGHSAFRYDIVAMSGAAKER